MYARFQLRQHLGHVQCDGILLRLIQRGLATDLRAGAALIIAALAAEGKTEITELQHIDRGYEDLIQKFQTIGADIVRMNDSEDAEA